MDNHNWEKWIIETKRNHEDLFSILNSSGIPFLDFEHQILIDYAVAIEQSVDSFSKQGADEDILTYIAKTLYELYEFSSHHFSKEQKLFSESFRKSSRSQAAAYVSPFTFVGGVQDYVIFSTH